MRTIFSALADRDLENIGDWVAQENPDRAYQLTRDLRHECTNLSVFPNRHAVYKSTEHGDIRRKVYGNYLIFYEVAESEIRIARILHGAQDYSDLF